MEEKSVVEERERFKVRMRFSKLGAMRFIGHLDLMRFFQKVIRRAGLSVNYSKGFSPHQLMSFASPLGVGTTSDGEYIDVEFGKIPEGGLPVIAKLMNEQMTDEVFISEIALMPDGFKNSMSLLKESDYLIVEKEDGVFPGDFRDKWMEFVNRDSYFIMKKTKRGEKEIDIIPLIIYDAFTLKEFEKKTGEDYNELNCEFFDRNADEASLGKHLFCSLSSSSEANLNPELLVSSFLKFCGLEAPDRAKYAVHRMQMRFMCV